MQIYESIVCIALGSFIIAAFFAGKYIGMQAAFNTGVDCNKFQFVNAPPSTTGSDKTLLLQQKEKYTDWIVNKRISKAAKSQINEDKGDAINYDGNANDKIVFKATANVPIKKMAYVKKKDFFQNYDMGINETISKQHLYKDPKNDHILMMYTKSGKRGNKLEIPIISSSKEATKDCEVMQVIGNRPRVDKHCLAYFNNYDTNHVQRFIRTGNQSIDSSKPLQHEGRGLQVSNLKNEFLPPGQRFIKTHWSLLNNYLNHVDSALEKVKSIIENIVNKDNTIVVMVCNEGQVSLLINFVCSSKAKGFDISMLLVFATDRETYEIATELGIEAFFDETIFGGIPNEHAQRYGDAIFTRIMWAKVLCTHMVSMLNINFLFQDLDVVWYQHPLDFFNPRNSFLSNHDIFFQPDGSVQIRYSPHSANSGFYYVKSNDKTRYLFTSFIYAGDLLWTTHSHQQVLGQLLAEHCSLFNLHVKILNKYDFPGGGEFHRESNYMSKFILQKENPWIFHMSWTLNKDDKLKFMKQMGMWYLQNDACESIERSNHENNNIAMDCCSGTPMISCHYRDKPSVIPCDDDIPSMDKGALSYWLRNPLLMTHNKAD